MVYSETFNFNKQLWRQIRVAYESSQREDNCILLPHKIKPLSKRTSLAVHEALSLSKWRSFSCHKSLSLHEGRPDNIESKVSF